MRVVLLGTAAGGGFPQWNCWCPTCQVARADPARAHPRTQSSIAVSGDGQRWFLLNASPDVRHQLMRLPSPATQGRALPFEAIVLTDAELDHSLGITLLREGRSLRLYATHAVAHTLENDSRILPLTRAFGSVAVLPLPLNATVELTDRRDGPTGLSVESFPVPGDPPRFASQDEAGHSVGLRITDSSTGGRLVYLPACAAFTPAVEDYVFNADAILFDGTFWSDDEPVLSGITDRTARQMGHMPIDGPDGSLVRLVASKAKARIYTHINNTNPVLIEDSPERSAVASAGIIVGDDGLAIDV